MVFKSKLGFKEAVGSMGGEVSVYVSGWIVSKKANRPKKSFRFRPIKSFV